MAGERPPGLEAADLRLVLPAALSWLVVLWALAAAPRWVVLAAAVLTLGLVWTACRRSWALACALALVLIALVGCGVRVAARQSSPVAEGAREGAVMSLEVVLDTDVRTVGQPGRERAIVAAHTRWIEVRGQRHQVRQPVKLAAGQAHRTALLAQPAGSHLRLTAKAIRADPGRSEAAELRLLAAPTPVKGPAWWPRQVNRVRAGLVASMAWSPAEQAGLAPSLVVGDTSALLPRTEAAFKKTGLTHLTAVSGANLTLLLATVLAASRLVGVRGWWLHLVAVAGTVVFVFVCRAEPSVMRAAAMGLVGLAALGNASDRRRGLRHLSTAVLTLMMLDPWLARSWGFALSVCASAGILWWGPVWRVAMERWLPRWLAESLAVPMAAQVATQPLVTALSGTVSTSGLLANVLAGPFVGPTTVFGLLAAVVALVWQLPATVLGWLAGWFVLPIILIAHAGAGLPASTWVWPPGASGVLLLTGFCLVAGLLLGWVLSRRWASLGLVILVVAAMVRQPPPGGWPGEWEIAFCSVGQGDATVLRAGPGTAVLVDTGPDSAPVERCLDSLGVRHLALIVLTHHHADHTGGLAGLLGKRRVGTVLVNPLASPAPAASRVTALAAARDVPVQVASAGQTLVVGRVEMRVIHAGARAGTVLGLESGESAVENDSSIVLVARAGNTTAVLPGDIEPIGQQVVMATNPDLRADLLKMPHHGSSRQDPAFWQATGASVAIASAGERNTHGHPSQAALRLATANGMRVLRTDAGESFALWVDRGRLQVRSGRLGG